MKFVTLGCRLLLLLLLWAPTATGPHAEPLVNSDVHLGSSEHPQTVRGQILARTSTTLSSEIAAKIASISVQDGDEFNLGDPLIILDCEVQRAQLDEATAAVRATSATRQVNQRLRQLNAAADLEIELALAEEAKAQARVNAMRAILSRCKIAAPFRACCRIGASAVGTPLRSPSLG